MFGYRTPEQKKATGAQASSPGIGTAGPIGLNSPPQQSQASKVRRSIEEWEVGKSHTEAKATSSPAVKERQKYVSRLTEAKACLQKAKLNLRNAKTMKTEIKNEVTLAVERLYELVKEAENSKSQDKKPNKNKQKEKDTDQEQLIDESVLIKKIDEHSRLITENNEKMEKLRETIEKHQEIQERKTYANVAATNAAPSQPKMGSVQRTESIQMYSIMVSSNEIQDTSGDVIEKIRKAVDAKTSGLTVDRIRKAKDQKVIVGCKTLTQAKIIADKIQTTAPELKVQEMENKDPLIIMRDIFTINTDEDILSALKNQNEEILANVSEEEYRAKIKYRKKTRNPNANHVVIQVSPKVWRALISAGKVHIDLQNIRVMDQSPLVQCSRCLGYGHTRKLCIESEDVCSHCGGPHMRNNCESWLAGDVPNCRNCRIAKSDKADHNAFNDICPIRKKWDALARYSVAYC